MGLRNRLLGEVGFVVGTLVVGTRVVDRMVGEDDAGTTVREFVEGPVPALVGALVGR